MEIERKFLIDLDKLPFCPEDYPCRHIEQGYLCTAPVVRIRRDNDHYFLTYKSKGLKVRFAAAWRRRGDSNPRTVLPAYSLSRGAPYSHLGTSAWL